MLAAHRQSVQVMSSVIVIEILKCLMGGVLLSLKLSERLGQKGLHPQIRSEVLYLGSLFLCDMGFLCKIICNFYLFI